MADGAGFEVKITHSEGGEIKLDTNMITSVEFEIDTVENNVIDRSGIVNRVVVTGLITSEAKDATKDLLLWSMAGDAKDIYRKAEIIIRINNTERVRKYEMDKIFCIDYVEKFSKDEMSGFTLTFAQRRDNFGGIKVIS